MKRFIAVVAAVALTVCLSACGGGKKDGETGVSGESASKSPSGNESAVEPGGAENSKIKNSPLLTQKLSVNGEEVEIKKFTPEWLLEHGFWFDENVLPNNLTTFAPKGRITVEIIHDKALHDNPATVGSCVEGSVVFYNPLNTRTPTYGDLIPSMIEIEVAEEPSEDNGNEGVRHDSCKVLFPFGLDPDMDCESFTELLGNPDSTEEDEEAPYVTYTWQTADGSLEIVYGKTMGILNVYILIDEAALKAAGSE